MSSKQRTLISAAIGLVCVWLLAWGGFVIAKHSKMTADKLRAYLESKDLAKMSAAERAKALRELADKINALPADERRKSRVERLWAKWFAEMTEEEKAKFLEETTPTGVKQMIEAFEQLAPEKRKKIIDDSIKRLRDERENLASAQGPGGGGGASVTRGGSTNRPAPLSPELQQKVTTIGLKTFYAESSPEMKAEVAPLLEEIQKNMEGGRFMRGEGR